MLIKEVTRAMNYNVGSERAKQILTPSDLFVALKKRLHP